MDEHVSAKQALRERLLTRRRELRGRDLAEAAGRLRDVLLADEAVAEAGTLAAYVSVGSEPGTGPLLDELEARGVQTLLPVLAADGDLDWARYTGPLGLAPAARGLMEPRARRLGPDAIATPVATQRRSRPTTPHVALAGMPAAYRHCCTSAGCCALA